MLNTSNSWRQDSNKYVFWSPFNTNIFLIRGVFLFFTNDCYCLTSHNFLSSLEKVLLEIPLQKIKFGSIIFASFCPLICLFSWGFNAKRNKNNNIMGFFYIGIALVPLPTKGSAWDLKRTTKNRAKNQVFFSASSFQKLVEREWMTVVYQHIPRMRSR